MTAPDFREALAGVLRDKIAAIREAIDRDEALARAAVENEPAPSGWLGPLLDTYDAHRRLLVLADDYSPELEHGDNGEWAFDGVVAVLADLYASSSTPERTETDE